MSRFRRRSVWLVGSQHPLPPYPPTTWLPLICGDDWMRECSCFNPALLCYHNCAAMADPLSKLECFLFFCSLSPYPQVDLFSNSGRRGFCSWQQRAVCLCATMPHLPLTSWCCCRAAARPSWKARRSWICPSCRQGVAGIAASPSSSPRVNTCCCWLTPLQTAGHSFALPLAQFIIFVREIRALSLNLPRPNKTKKKTDLVGNSSSQYFQLIKHGSVNEVMFEKWNC